MNQRNWMEKKRMVFDLTYESASNLKMDLDQQILSRFQRPPGALTSSMLGLESLTGSLEDFGIEDYLNVPQDSETFRPANMHHCMEGRGALNGDMYAHKYGDLFYPKARVD